MTRNIKALGLVFLATFAMSAIAASAAQAEGLPTLTPASYPAWLTIAGEGNQVMTTNTGQKVECTTVTGQATIEKAGVGDTNVTFADIKYGGCTALIGTSTLPATVDVTGCNYVMGGGETDPVDNTHYINGGLIYECPAGVTGPDVTIFSSAANHTAGTALCHITNWQPFAGGGLTRTNSAGAPDTVTVKAANITNDITRSGSILCGNPTSATYTGAITIKAFKDEGFQADKTTPKEGAQIILTVSHL
jgi:hypothetical protein